MAVCCGLGVSPISCKVVRSRSNSLFVCSYWCAPNAAATAASIADLYWDPASWIAANGGCAVEGAVADAAAVSAAGPGGGGGVVCDVAAAESKGLVCGAPSQ